MAQRETGRTLVEVNLAAEAFARRERASVRTFTIGYFSILVAILGAALVGRLWLGIDPFRSGFVLCGVLYLWGWTQRPPVIYQIVRRVGWFSGITDERRMRWTLLGLGISLVLIGVFAPIRQLIGR